MSASQKGGPRWWLKNPIRSMGPPQWGHFAIGCGFGDGCGGCEREVRTARRMARNVGRDGEAIRIRADRKAGEILKRPESSGYSA